jgi:hypothetical protein
VKGKEAFSVRKVKLTTNGRSYTQWKVDGRINGARFRKHFAEKVDAEAYRAEMNVRALNESKEVRVTASHLSADELRDAESALRRLNGRYSLSQAVDWFLQTYRDTLTNKTFSEAVPCFLEDRGQHVRSRTLYSYKKTLETFGISHGKRKLPEISTGDVDGFLRGKKLRGKAWNNNRADLNAFFAWAEKAPRKWITENPVKDVQKFKVVQGLPEILSADTVSELFKFLETYTGMPTRPQPAGCMIPYFALATFAGIRPSNDQGEITRIAALEKRDRIIDLKAGVIRITPDIAKTRDVRQIVIQPNLAAWLKRYPLDRFPIMPRNVLDMLAEVRKKFSIGHDVLRHTFISMHVAKFRSMGDAALQAGNSEHMIKKHYLNLVTAAEAEEFWSVVPTPTNAGMTTDLVESRAAVEEEQSAFGTAA